MTTLGATYLDFNNIIFDENNENLLKTRQGYFQIMGKYFLSYLEWSKEQFYSLFKEEDLNDENKKVLDEIIESCWLFGMDLYTAVTTANEKTINFSKFAEPSEEKIKLYMDDQELKSNALNKYDIYPCINFFVHRIIFPNVIETQKNLLNYSFKEVNTLKYLLAMLPQDIFVMCYLQFER